MVAGLPLRGEPTHLESSNTRDRWRWAAVAVFVLSSTLNYLDRLLLVFLAPLIIKDLRITHTQFGLLLSVFSVAYSASSLFAGSLLDRFGVTKATTTAVAWWSLAAMGTSLTRGIGGLAVCRAALGIGESVGVPAAGKLNAGYLRTEERALGAAVNQIGLSAGAVLAPLSVGLAMAMGWRVPFLVTGLLGFCWIPLWLLLSERITPVYATEAEAREPLSWRESIHFLRDRNVLLLTVATALWMGSYSLWSNWTPLYLANVYQLQLKDVARYAWIPPLVSNVGGFFGGWLSYRLIRRAVSAAKARRRAVWISSVCALSALFLPWAPDAAWATVCISAGYFFSLAGSVNLYALPIDLFGAKRTGLALSALTCAFGIMQAILSPLIGALADHHAYNAVVPVVTVPLLMSAAVLGALRLDGPASER